MKITYQSTTGSPGVSFYVRRSYRVEEPIYDYCEVNETRYDVLQAQVDSSDVAEDVKIKADGLRGQAFGWVKSERITTEGW